jgi:hypothetical protein
MVRSAIVALVSFCTARPLSIFLVALIIAAGSATYAVQHFALKTDVNDLISQNLPWVQRGAQFLKDFPLQQIVVVVDAPTSEQVEQASAKLLTALTQRAAGSLPCGGRTRERSILRTKRIVVPAGCRGRSHHEAIERRRHLYRLARGRPQPEGIA